MSVSVMYLIAARLRCVINVGLWKKLSFKTERTFLLNTELRLCNTHLQNTEIAFMIKSKKKKKF